LRELIYILKDEIGASPKRCHKLRKKYKYKQILYENQIRIEK
jgi:hypothetical protein